MALAVQTAFFVVSMVISNKPRGLSRYQLSDVPTSAFILGGCWPLALAGLHVLVQTWARAWK